MDQSCDHFRYQRALRGCAFPPLGLYVFLVHANFLVQPRPVQGPGFVLPLLERLSWRQVSFWCT